MITLQQITDIMQQAGFGGPERSVGLYEFRSLSSSAKISFFCNGPNWAVIAGPCYMVFDDMRLENDFLMFDRDGGHAGNIWTTSLNGFNVGNTN